MEILDFVPGISSVRFYERAHDTDVPFEYRLHDAVVYGMVSGGQFIIASELGIHSMGMIRAAQATVAAAQAAPVVLPAVAVAAGTTLLYESKVSESIRRSHHRTPYYGPFAGTLGTVV